MKPIFKKLKHEKLTRAERKQLKTNLLAFVARHPLYRPERTIFSLFSWPRYRYATVALIISLVVALAGGTTYAAEQTLPGDLLYPVKIHVNEEIKAVLILSPEKKIEWEVRRAERRLEEAEHLTARGALKVEVRTKIEEQFVKQANRVQERIKKFEDRGHAAVAAELNYRFETSLAAHERIIERLNETRQTVPTVQDPIVNQVNPATNSIPTTLTPLLLRIRQEASATIEDRLRTEEQTKTQAESGLEKRTTQKRNKAQKTLGEVKKLISRAKLNIAIYDTTRAELEFETAANFFMEGEIKLKAKSYGEAFVLFQQAERSANHVRSLIEFRQKRSEKTTPIISVDINTTSPLLINAKPDAKQVNQIEEKPREDREIKNAVLRPAPVIREYSSTSFRLAPTSTRGVSR